MNRTTLKSEKNIDFRAQLFKELRLKNNLSLRQLSKLTGITVNTILDIEKGRLNGPTKYNYYYIICKIFNIDHISYFNLDKLNEDTLEDVILKFKVYLGFRNNQQLSKYIFNNKYTIDGLFKYKNRKPKNFEEKSIIIVETFQEYKNKKK